MASPEDEILAMVQEKIEGGGKKPPQKVPELGGGGLPSGLELRRVFEDRRILAGVGGALLLILGIVTYFLLFSAPTYTYKFVDAEGNPLSGVKVTFIVDGKTVEKTTGPDGTISLKGKEVDVDQVYYPGYTATSLNQEGENEYSVVLAPKTKKVRVEAKSDRRYVEATIKVYVNGDEVFSDTGTRVTVCFSEVKYKDCIVAKGDDTVTFKATAEGYKEASREYRGDDLPSRVTLSLEKVEDEADKRESLVQNYADLMIYVKYQGDDDVVNGTITIAPASSIGGGAKSISIKSGYGYMRVPVGAYRVTSAEVLVGGKVVSAEVVSGSSFTVTAPKTTVNVLLKKPKVTYNITFTVRDENGNPLPATIQLNMGGTILRRTTNDGGVASFELSKEGCGTYSVTSEGYESNTGRICTGQTMNIVLKKMVYTGVVRVHVYDVREEPLVNAAVSLYDTNGNFVGFSGYTDDNGIVEFNAVPVGTYVAEAVFDSLTEMSTTFSVEKDRTTDVHIYITPTDAQLNVYVYEGNVPVPSATVSVVTTRGKKLAEGITGIDGTVSLQATSYIKFYVNVAYKEGGRDYLQRFGPYEVPPGVSTYDLNLEITPMEDGNIIFIGLKNKDGELTGSMKRGEGYWVLFRVAHSDEGPFVVELPKVLDRNAEPQVLDTIPEANVSEGVVTFNLQPDKRIVIEDIAVKLLVPYTYLDNILEVSYGKEAADKSVYIPVGFEMRCTKFLCYDVRVTDSETGKVLGPRDTLKIEKNYNVEIYLFSRVTSSPLYAFTYLRKEQTGEEDLIKQVVLVPGQIETVEYNLPRATDPTAISFIATVKGAPQASAPTLEEVILGTWSVYVADFGKIVLSSYGLSYAAFGDAWYTPPSYFFPGDYYTLKITLDEPPKTPVTVDVTCDGVTQVSQGGIWSKEVSIPVGKLSCSDGAVVHLSAMGYEDTVLTFAPFPVNNVAVIATTPFIQMAEQNGAVEFRGEGPAISNFTYIFRPLDYTVDEECGLAITGYSNDGPGTSRSVNVSLKWDGMSCVGSRVSEDFRFKVYVDWGGAQAPIPAPYVAPVDVLFGKLWNCVQVKSSRAELLDGKDYYRISFEIENSCPAPLEVNVASVLPEGDTQILDLDGSTTELDGEPVDSTSVEIGGNKTASLDLNIPIMVEYITKPSDYYSFDVSTVLSFRLGELNDTIPYGPYHGAVYGTYYLEPVMDVAFELGGDALKATVTSNLDMGPGADTNTKLISKVDHFDLNVSIPAGNTFTVFLHPDGTKAPREVGYRIQFLIEYPDGHTYTKEVNGRVSLISPTVHLSPAGVRRVTLSGSYVYNVVFKLAPAPSSNPSNCSMREIVTNGYNLNRGMDLPVLCECNGSFDYTNYYVDLYVWEGGNEFSEVSGGQASVGLSRDSCTLPVVIESGQHLTKDLVFYEPYSYDETRGAAVLSMFFISPDLNLQMPPGYIDKWMTEWLTKGKISDIAFLSSIVAAAHYAKICPLTEENTLEGCDIGYADTLQEELNAFAEYLGPIYRDGNIEFNGGLILVPPNDVEFEGGSASFGVDYNAQEVNSCAVYQFTFSPTGTTATYRVRIYVPGSVYPGYLPDVDGSTVFNVVKSGADEITLVHQACDLNTGTEKDVKLNVTLGALRELGEAAKISYRHLLKAFLLGKGEEIGSTVFFVSPEDGWSNEEKDYYFVRFPDGNTEEGFGEAPPCNEVGCFRVYGPAKAFLYEGYAEDHSAGSVFQLDLTAPCDDVSWDKPGSVSDMVEVNFLCVGDGRTRTIESPSTGPTMVSFPFETGTGTIVVEKNVVIYRYEGYIEDGNYYGDVYYGAEPGCLEVRDGSILFEPVGRVVEANVDGSISPYKCVVDGYTYAWREVGSLYISFEVPSLNTLDVTCGYVEDNSVAGVEALTLRCGDVEESGNGNTVSLENVDLSALVQADGDVGTVSCTCTAKLSNNTTKTQTGYLEVYRVDNMELTDYKVLSVDGNSYSVVSGVGDVSSGWYDQEACFLNGKVYDGAAFVSLYRAVDGNYEVNAYLCNAGRWEVAGTMELNSGYGNGTWGVWYSCQPATGYEVYAEGSSSGSPRVYYCMFNEEGFNEVSAVAALEVNVYTYENYLDTTGGTPQIQPVDGWEGLVEGCPYHENVDLGYSIKVQKTAIRHYGVINNPLVYSYESNSVCECRNGVCGWSSLSAISIIELTKSEINLVYQGASDSSSDCIFYDGDSQIDCVRKNVETGDTTCYCEINVEKIPDYNGLHEYSVIQGDKKLLLTTNIYKVRNFISDTQLDTRVCFDTVPTEINYYTIGPYCLVFKNLIVPQLIEYDNVYDCGNNTAYICDRVLNTLETLWVNQD